MEGAGAWKRWAASFVLSRLSLVVNSARCPGSEDQGRLSLRHFGIARLWEPMLKIPDEHLISCR